MRHNDKKVLKMLLNANEAKTRACPMLTELTRLAAFMMRNTCINVLKYINLLKKACNKTNTPLD